MHVLFTHFNLENCLNFCVMVNTNDNIMNFKKLLIAATLQIFFYSLIFLESKVWASYFVFKVCSD